MTKLSPSRQTVISAGPWPLNAAYVLIATIGFTTGAESRYVIAHDTGSPFCMSRRITGTTPHSHIGNTAPSRPLTAIAATGFFGSSRVSRRAGTKTSMSPEISAPSSRNGMLSKSTPRNANAKSCR